MSHRFWFFSLLCFILPLFAQAKERPTTLFAGPKANNVKTAVPPVSQKDIEKFDLELMSPHNQVKKGVPFLVGLRIKIPPGWYSYWSFAGDFGQAPKFNWRPIENVRIEPLPFPTPERKAFSINEKQSYSFIYERELLIPFEILIEKNYAKDHLPLFLDLQWFVCKELCFSKEASLTLNLKVRESFEVHSQSKKVFDFHQSFFPKALGLESHFEVKDKKLIVHFSFEEEIQCLDLLPSQSVDFFHCTTRAFKSRPRLLRFSNGKDRFQPSSNFRADDLFSTRGKALHCISVQQA